MQEKEKTMKFKSRKVILLISLLSALIVLISGYLIRRYVIILLADKTWIADFGYEDDEIHKLTFDRIGNRSCPEIPVQIKDTKFNIIFDTGCGTGVQFTDEVEDKIDFTLQENIEALNRDGSHRGWNKVIEINQMSVFGEEFKNITTSISNWSMYSSSKFNGLIGLYYFDSKVITLDYEGYRIGISSNPIDYTQLNEDKYVVLPLYKTTSQGQQDLLFFEASYNNQPIIVYLDTGKNYSYLYNSDCNRSMEEKPTNYLDIPLKIGRLEIKMKDIVEANNIAQADGLPYPTMIELNSDQIWKCKLLVTIDLIEQKIIFNHPN